MASPNGWLYDTPAKQLHDEAQARHNESPRSGARDSPSLQLLLESRRQSEAYERELRARLDRQFQEEERIHVSELAAAQAEHERIRAGAERAQIRLELDQQKERQQQEEEDREALGKEIQDQIEREMAARQRQREAQREIEERRRAVAQAEADARARAAANEELRVAREKEERKEAERARQLAEEREAEQQLRQRQQEVEAVRKAAQSTQAAQQSASVLPPQPTQPANAGQQTSSSDLTTPLSVREATHQKYLNLHQHLKEMRSFVVQQSKQNPEVKKRLGEMRRALRKCVGQLTAEKGANRKPIQDIRTILQEAKKIEQPSVDAQNFLVSQPPSAVDASQSRISAMFIYLVNIFSKAVISQFINEAGVAPKAADPIGIVAISIFAATEFRWQDTPFIDVLLAKYHKLCPVLFGIYGNDKTEAGRRRLGWYFDKDAGSWVGEQRHGERMTGLGAGYASLTLRDFRKSASTNPLPPVHYWRALACIVNTPPQEATPTHFIVLKALVELNVPRFIGFFGQAAVVALRQAIIVFPKSAPKSVAATALTTLVPSLKRDAHLTLGT